MAYDLLIKNGWVVDGSGRPRYRADVGVSGGRIAAIGRIRESAREVLDAEGQVVSPGFVDGHTHMDAQVFWDPLGTCSCWHGITTVVMGNCGFTLAPCAKEDRHLVIRNLQRAEDISLEAMEAGIEWKWKTFAEFLDTVDGLPKGINYSGYMGHSALRTYVMGERAFEQAASEDDLRAMEAELRSGLRAGAIGFTTSRSPSHETPDRRPVASRMAKWDEVRRLVGVMGDMNAGIFELAGEAVDRDPNHPGLSDYHRRLRELAVETGRPVTFGLFSRRDAPEAYKAYVQLLEDTAAQGGRMTAQVHSRALSAVLSFKTQLPFDRLPVWNELRALPLDEQKRRLRDPELRKKLVAAAREREDRKAIGTEARPAVYEWIHVMETVHGPHKSVAEIAQARGVDPVEAMIDLGLETDRLLGSVGRFAPVFLRAVRRGEAVPGRVVLRPLLGRLVVALDRGLPLLRAVCLGAFVRCLHRLVALRRTARSEQQSAAESHPDELHASNGRTEPPRSRRCRPAAGPTPRACARCASSRCRR